jgi:hypothetical protein
MQKNFVSVSIGIATASLAVGYGLESSWTVSGLIMTLGLVWLVSQRFNWPGLPDIGLVATMGVAAFGMWQGIPAGWMLLAAVGALAAWDLAHFERHLALAPPRGNEARLRQEHLRTVAAVAGSGLLLGGAALSFEIKFGLGWAMGLALLVILGLGRIIRAIRE